MASMGYLNIRSRIAFCAYSESSDLSRLANILKDSPVQFYGLSAHGQRLYGYVRKGDFKRLCELANEHGFTVKEEACKGIYFVTKGYHLRFGIIAGALLSAAMVFLLSDRVMMIEIGGNESVSEERIISLLKDNGIYIGSSLSKTDLRAAEKRILSMDKDIAWIGIRRTGSRVVVEIDETAHIPDMERKSNPANIVAAKDAQIKSVRVYNGMLIPMVGDAVKKGDVIISGVVDTKYGRSYYVHSMGEITGVYTEKMTFSRLLCDKRDICVGEVTKKAISFFGKRFVYSSDGSVSGRYEYFEEEYPLKLKNITFPVSVIKMRYRLIESEEIILTENQASALLYERAERYEKNFLSENTVVTDRKFIESTNGESVSLTAVYTVEGEIGEERMIFAEYEGFYE